MPNARAYCFTINNYTDEDIAQCDALQAEAKYIIYGKEKGDNGTPHLQGYVYFENARSFSRVKKALPRAHLEFAKGSPQSNITYCSKQGDVTEFGPRPFMGKRSDIDKAREIVKETGKMSDVVSQCESYQSLKVAETYLKYHEAPRKWWTEIRWYYGPSGVGKSRAALTWLEEDGKEVYECMGTAKWFEGYDGHEHVIINDFRKDFIKFHDLLRLLDRYQFRVETKGGSRQFRARKLAITSPYHPVQVYSTREDVYQLIRRIGESGGQIIHVEADVGPRKYEHLMECVHYEKEDKGPDFIDGDV